MSYSPSLGRWLQQDPNPAGPYADGMNLYQYVGSSPVTLRDPMGLEGATTVGSPPTTRPTRGIGDPFILPESPPQLCPTNPPSPPFVPPPDPLGPPSPFPRPDEEWPPFIVEQPPPPPPWVVNPPLPPPAPPKPIDLGETEPDYVKDFGRGVWWVTKKAGKGAWWVVRKCTPID